MILKKYTPFFVVIIQWAMLSDAVSQTHWETAIYTEDTWYYFVGTSAPPTNWNELDFDESSCPAVRGALAMVMRMITPQFQIH